MTPPFEFVPAAGGWLVCDLALASHESAHAVVAIKLGLQVREVRVDRPLSDIHGDDLGGWCNVVANLDRLGAHLASTLAGPLVDGRPLQWRPRLDATGDERVAALLTDRLQLDEVGWLHWQAVAITILRESRKATSAIAGRLLEVGAIDGDEVRALILEAEGALPRRAQEEVGLVAVGGGL